MHKSTVKLRHASILTQSLAQNKFSIHSTVSCPFRLEHHRQATRGSPAGMRGSHASAIPQRKLCLQDFHVSYTVISQNTSSKPRTAEHICHLHNVRVERNPPFQMPVLCCQVARSRECCNCPRGHPSQAEPAGRLASYQSASLGRCCLAWGSRI